MIYFSDSSTPENVGTEGDSGSNQVCCYPLNSTRSFSCPWEAWHCSLLNILSCLAVYFDVFVIFAFLFHVLDDNINNLCMHMCFPRAFTQYQNIQTSNDWAHESSAWLWALWLHIAVWRNSLCSSIKFIFFVIEGFMSHFLSYNSLNYFHYP